MQHSRKERSAFNAVMLRAAAANGSRRWGVAHFHAALSRSQFTPRIRWNFSFVKPITLSTCCKIHLFSRMATVSAGCTISSFIRPTRHPRHAHARRPRAIERGVSRVSSVHNFVRCPPGVSCRAAPISTGLPCHLRAEAVTTAHEKRSIDFAASAGTCPGATLGSVRFSEADFGQYLLHYVQNHLADYRRMRLPRARKGRAVAPKDGSFCGANQKPDSRTF